MNEATIIRKLARLVYYSSSHVPEEHMDAILGWLDKIDMGQRLEQEVIAKNFTDSIRKIQEAIQIDLPSWREWVKALVLMVASGVPGDAAGREEQIAVLIPE